MSVAWPALLGLLIIAFPTLRYIAVESWATEQGSHSPLVLASGLWLLVNLQHEIRPLQERPPVALTSAAIIAMAAALLVFRAAAVIELEVYALYGLFVAVLYAFIGWPALKGLWFPLLYLGFAVPLPDSLIAAITNPLKLWISETAVDLLYLAGYPIASSGVTIQIGQYQLLVAQACAGLNSLITLSALTLFYVYLTHRAEWRYMLGLTLAAVPVAIFSNLVRVIILVLLTYYAGEAAAQGFLHYFAGMTTFAVALVSIYLIDKLAQQTLGRSRQQRSQD
ncbi:exosortase V [Erythrobacter sp. sf7]|uniref:Exosortase V n=1 Tax=Erythrobacter fulvus TaxID=2987523 RepID=A0ABT5JLV7_9SPHN|nr:exosortase V [Erythrobacter fulvus]MDC8753594.1 exosortase V [Erythrobacter fulvus]